MWKKYNGGWVAVLVNGNDDNLIGCGFNETNKLFRLDHYAFNNKELIFKGITPDNYPYLIFNEFGTYIVYILTKINNNGTAFISIFTSNIKNLSWELSKLPNAIYYYDKEYRLCPDANPIIQDIFIEVDWMWEGPKYYCWNNVLYWYNSIGSRSKDIKHKMNLETKEKVKDIFANNGINIHIDDGNLGGGGPVPFRNEISWEKQDGYKDFWKLNDYFDFVTLFFDFIYPERHRVYHYCLYAHYLYDLSSKSVKKDAPGCASKGYSIYFAIFNASYYQADARYITFTHELGHNLLGTRYDATHYGDIYLDEDGHHFIDMRTSSLRCIMQPGGEGSTFCSRCWNELDLAASLKED